MFQLVEIGRAWYQSGGTVATKKANKEKKRKLCRQADMYAYEKNWKYQKGLTRAEIISSSLKL